MIELVLVAVFSSSSPVPGFRSLPPPPPPPVESVVLVSGSSPAPVVTPPSPAPQPQPQEPIKESWAEKMWKRYTQNKGGQ
jgi:hypothetical protein